MHADEPLNVASWLERAGRSGSDLPAMAVGDRLFASYGQMARRSAGLASSLRLRGRLQDDDRVAIVATNHPACLETLFGIWWAGLVAVPVNAKLHASEIDWIAEHADARLLFVSPDLEGLVGMLNLPAVNEIVGFDSRRYDVLAAGEPAPVADRRPDDTAWLFYTSGTTGRPKGAMLSHANLVAMSLGHLVDVDPTRSGDGLLHAAPLSDGSGMLVIPHVCRMGLNVIPKSGGFDPVAVLELVERWTRASMFAGPTMIRRLVDAPSSLEGKGIRTNIWRGAAMLVADALRALERFGPCFSQIYGQGETPTTITVLSKADVCDRTHPRWLERLGSAGVANSMVEVRVGGVDQPAFAPGEPGEVLVRGATVMSGYWNDAAATAAALRNRWLHTGDIGAFDDEGYLFLKDRSKDLIISGGSNIYPRELEEVLVSHPQVTEASVIGRPNAEWGEIGVAYVVGAVTAVELDRLCLDRIARFKRPKDYVFVASLPKNNTGKILKTELRALDDARMRDSAPGAT